MCFVAQARYVWPDRASAACWYMLTSTEVNYLLYWYQSTNTDASWTGITGAVELAALDGPFVVLRFTGRFWHRRTTVMG